MLLVRQGTEIAFPQAGAKLVGQIDDYVRTGHSHTATMRGDFNQDDNYKFCDMHDSLQLDRGRKTKVQAVMNGWLTRNPGLLLAAPSFPVVSRFSVHCDGDTAPIVSRDRHLQAPSTTVTPAGDLMIQALDFPRQQIRFGQGFTLRSQVTDKSDPGSSPGFDRRRTRIWEFTITFVPCGANPKACRA